MAIPRGTTPTFVLTTDNQTVDWTEAAHVYCTFGQGHNVITKEDSDMDIEARSIGVYFTQAETLGFKAGKNVDVQVNWTFNNGNRAATEIAHVVLSENLIGTVIE